jgi:hypothetical protein
MCVHLATWALVVILSASGDRGEIWFQPNLPGLGRG